MSVYLKKEFYMHVERQSIEKEFLIQIKEQRYPSSGQIEDDKTLKVLDARNELNLN